MAWYQEVLRWGQTNLTEQDPSRYPEDFWRRYWKTMNIGGVIVNAAGIVAYFPSDQSLQYRAFSLGGGDLFGRIVRLARQDGLAVVARMDCNRAGPDFYAAHPDWFCVDGEGKPYLSQGRYFTCVNSVYYTDFIPALLREIIEKYHPDGFTDNSWSGLRQDKICYCARCAERFLADCGCPLPRRADWSDPVFRRYVRWNYDLRRRLWQRFDATTRQWGGPDCRWIGMMHADPANESGHYVDLQWAVRQAPMLFCDQQCRPETAGFAQNLMNGEMLHSLAAGPVLAAESMAHYVTGRRTFRLCAAPAAEVRAWAVNGIAGGLLPWYHHISAGTEDRRKFDSTREVNNWHSQAQCYLTDRRNLAGIGLVWSGVNADFYGRDQKRFRVTAPWHGWTEALTDAGVPAVPLHADRIGESGLPGTLILPDLAAMTDGQLEAVCAFVRQGGNIIFTGRTGWLDEEGEQRNANPLWQLLNIRLTESRETEAGPDGNWENDSRHTYLALPEKRHPILEDWADTDLLGFGGTLQAVRSEGCLEGICGYVPPFPIYPPEMCVLPPPEEGAYTVFAGDTPWGGRAVYFAGDVDRCFGLDRLPDHGRLLAQAACWASERELPFRLESAGRVATALYGQGSRRILHLVNNTGPCCRPGWKTEELPLWDVRLVFRRRIHGPVRCLVEGSALTPVWNGETSMLTVPRVRLHEVLVWEEEI